MSRKVALVTGSTRGIGRAIAVQLAGEGINMVVNGRHLDENAKKSLALCRKEGIEAHFFQGDISSDKDREELITKIKAAFGRLDILVNNAGVAPEKREDMLQMSEESFDTVISINLKGTFFLTQLIASWMIEQKKDNPERDPLIINISSMSAYTPSINRAQYCISKAGISMVTKLFAVRLAEYGINVYEIRPGIIHTDMTSAVKEKYDKLIGEGLLPIKRWGKPEDVGKAVAGLIKGFYRYSTGEVINVDGGFHLRRL